MTDSLLPQAPSLDEPLEMLEACHGRIEAQLQTLERLLDYLPAHGADGPARQAARNVLRYFEAAGPNHHEDEEVNVFPTLIARAAVDEVAMVKALVGDLLADHARMAAALARVRMQLATIVDGRGDELDEADVRRMAGLYRQHIGRENRELLPLSRRLLLPADIAVLSVAMTERRTSRRAGSSSS